AVAYSPGDDLRLFDDLFDFEQADDAAQVAFHDQPQQRLAFLLRFGQELLGRGANTLRIGLDLDLRHRLDGDGDALRGVQLLLGRHVKRHQLERELLETLKQWPDDAPAAGHDVCATPTVDNQGAVRSHAAKERADG